MRAIDQQVVASLSPEQLKLIAVWLREQASQYETTTAPAAVNHCGQCLLRMAEMKTVEAA